MSLTYIIGARQTGKSVELRKYWKPLGCVVMVLDRFTLSQLRRAGAYPRNAVLVCPIMNYDTVVRGCSRLLVDDMNLLPVAVQSWVIEQSRFMEVYATIQTCVLNPLKPEPFWQVRPTHTIKLPSPPHDVAELVKTIPMRVLITEYLGYFIHES